MKASSEVEESSEAQPIWKSALFWGALLLLVVTRLFSLPTSYWEFDETLFAEAIRSYDPLQHHPPPPGYPLFVSLGQLINFIVGDPFRTLLVLSLSGTLAGFCFLTLAFQNFTGNTAVGIAGAFLFYFSPVMLVHSTLPISDPLALGFLAASLWVASRLAPKSDLRSVTLFAALASLTVGCRPQFSIAVVPLIVFMVFRLRSPRRALVLLGVFSAVSLAWLIPLMNATGGIEGFFKYESGQASYFAAHDADISRGGRTLPQIVLRFVAHPWGPKWLSIPLLIAAMFGAWKTMSQRQWRVLPLVFAAVPYLLFCLAMMDPADGPRYALPFAIFVALLAPVGLFALFRSSIMTLAGAAIFAVGALVYTGPFLLERATSPSPPAQAALYAHRLLPRDSVILVELPLWPQGKHLLHGFRVRKVEEGWQEFFSRGDVPVYVFADGESEAPGAKNFSWADRDVYGKITRGHYRVVSLIPLPPGERFRTIRGVFPGERTFDGLSWRWLGDESQILLPDVDASRVKLTMTLPPRYPLAGNAVDIFLNGRVTSSVVLKRNSSRDVVLRIPDGNNVVTFRPRATYVPSHVPESGSRDPRRLSVQLTGVQQIR